LLQFGDGIIAVREREEVAAMHLQLAEEAETAS
jgi:hypothetical protein